METLEKQVVILEKKVAKHEILEEKVAKHDKVLKELTETLLSQMAKIDLSTRLQQEVEDLQNENRELKSWSLQEEAKETRVRWWIWHLDEVSRENRARGNIRRVWGKGYR